MTKTKTKPRNPKKPITNEEFDAALEELLDEMSAGAILQIPGVYEAVSEELNNEAIDRAEANRGD